MMHYSCDSCGKDLAQDQSRYVLKLEGAAGTNSSPSETQSTTEGRIPPAPGASGEDDFCPTTRMRFDLCSKCYSKSLEVALSREVDPEEYGATPLARRFLCGECGRRISSTPSAHGVVNLEGWCVGTDLVEAHESLSDGGAEGAEDIEVSWESEDEHAPPNCDRARFDLCPTCYRQFISDPLGRDRRATFDFGYGGDAERLIVKALTRPGAKAEEIARDIQRLYRALNEYHLAYGGSGLTVEDFEWMVAAAVAEGV